MVVILENRIKHQVKYCTPVNCHFLLMRGVSSFFAGNIFPLRSKVLVPHTPLTPKELHCFGCPSVPDQNVARYLAKCNIMNLIVFYCVGLQ